MFIRWVSELGHQAIVVLGIDLLVTLILKVIQQAFAQVPNTGNGGVAAFENLLGLSGVIFLLSFTVPVFFVVLDNIFAATGVPTLTTPARLIGDATGAIMGYAAGGAAVAGRAAGAVAETAGEIVTGAGASAIRRMSAPCKITTRTPPTTSSIGRPTRATQMTGRQPLVPTPR